MALIGCLVFSDSALPPRLSLKCYIQDTNIPIKTMRLASRVTTHSTKRRERKSINSTQKAGKWKGLGAAGIGEAYRWL
jgi:hypothetical protein